MRAWLLAAVVLLAGCGDDGGGGGDDGDGDGDQTTNGTTTTGTNTTGPPGGPSVGSCEGTATAGVVLTARVRCEFAEAGDVASAQAAVIELTWGTLQPGVVDVELSVETDECNQGVGDEPCTIADTQGTTAPLRIELNAEQIATHAPDNLAGFAGIFGAGQQDLTIYISLFPTPDIPEGYSAVG